MVPAQFVVLDKLPLTPNGKIDRKALPTPEFESATGFSQPVTPTEDLLAALWAGVLKHESIGGRITSLNWVGIRCWRPNASPASARHFKSNCRSVRCLNIQNFAI